MTGFAPPRGDTDLPTRSSEVSPCGCHPARGVYCSLAEGLVRAYVDTVDLNDHYGDRLPLNIAVFTLSIHWGFDRAATLIALLSKLWFDRTATVQMAEEVTSSGQISQGVIAPGSTVAAPPSGYPLRRIP